jgi:hypothetical protein
MNFRRSNDPQPQLGEAVFLASPQTHKEIIMSNFQNILESIETFVLNEVQQAEAKVAQWWKGIEPVVEDDFNKFVAALKPVAFGLVTGLAEAALGGPDKLVIASATLLQVAKAQGLAATKTMADTLVQQIVASLGANKPQ